MRAFPDLGRQENTEYDWASRMPTYLARIADQPASGQITTRIHLPIVA